MALDIFLKLDGIEGESTDSTHPREVTVLSFGWGVSNTGGAGPGGGGAGKAQFQSLSVVKPIDRASPPLFLACASGKHIKQAVLTVRRGGGAGEFLSVGMTDCLVASLSDAVAHDAGTALETVTLAFSAITVEYRPQKPDGSFDTPVAAGWNLVKNQSI